MHWLNDYAKVVDGSSGESVCCDLNFIIAKFLDTFDVGNFLALTCSSFLLYQVLLGNCGSIFIKVFLIAVVCSKCFIICAVLVSDLINDGILILALYAVIIFCSVKHCEELVTACYAVSVCIVFPCILCPCVLTCKKRNDQVRFHLLCNFIRHFSQCVCNIFICDGVCCCGVQTVVLHTFDVGGIQSCISIIICV